MPLAFWVVIKKGSGEHWKQRLNHTMTEKILQKKKLV